MALRSLFAEPDRPAGQIDWPALEARDVFKIYRSGPVEAVALRGLDLRVERREVVALLGPSGCGKSTFLALAAGLCQPSAGELRYCGRPLGRFEETELADYRARELAIVFQSQNLWHDLSAEENVLLALRLAGRAGGREQAAAALRRFGLGSRARHRAGALSGGEQQRVAIAAAAARSAPLVLADEPTGELGAGDERVVLDALLDLRESHGSTVVIVTHSARVADAVDRVIELRDGRAV